MRDLKFRAWNGKSMVYGGFSIHASGMVDTSILAGDIKDVMQFTGLKDKNGKDIYEGDIVKLLHRKTEKGGWVSNSNEIGQVEFNSDWGVRFHCKDKTQRTAIHWRSEGSKLSEASEIEVIGNIYQNKDHEYRDEIAELLEYLI